MISHFFIHIGIININFLVCFTRSQESIYNLSTSTSRNRRSAADETTSFFGGKSLPMRDFNSHLHFATLTKLSE